MTSKSRNIAWCTYKAKTTSNKWYDDINSVTKKVLYWWPNKVNCNEISCFLFITDIVFLQQISVLRHQITFYFTKNTKWKKKKKKFRWSGTFRHGFVLAAYAYYPCKCWYSDVLWKKYNKGNYKKKPTETNKNTPPPPPQPPPKKTPTTPPPP